jgi:hypothetical protein
LTANELSCKSEKIFCQARLGEHNLESDFDGATPLDYVIARTLIHPNYSRTKYHNDIAILTLQNSVQFSDKISPICLPAPGFQRLRTVVWSFIFCCVDLPLT